MFHTNEPYYHYYAVDKTHTIFMRVDRSHSIHFLDVCSGEWKGTTVSVTQAEFEDCKEPREIAELFIYRLSLQKEFSR